MENLKVYSLRGDIERALEAAELPLHAKVYIAKEVFLEFEKKYLQMVQAEFAENQRQMEEAKKAQEAAAPKEAPKK